MWIIGTFGEVAIGILLFWVGWKARGFYDKKFR